MSDTIFRTYPHKLAAKHALTTAGYKLCRDKIFCRYETWKCGNTKVELRPLLGSEQWEIGRSA